MLCTPPAFILSQDQTLEIIISYLGLPSYNLFELFFLSFSYFVEYINSWVSLKNSSLTRLVFRTYNLLCTYLLLFNFQWPLLSLFRDSLVIIPHSLLFVNTFLKLFSKFFSGFWQSFKRCILPPSRTAFLFYHSSPFLSSIFWEFFSNCIFHQKPLPKKHLNWHFS